MRTMRSAGFVLAATLIPMAVLLITPGAAARGGRSHGGLTNFFYTAPRHILRAQLALERSGYLEQGSFSPGEHDTATRRALKRFQRRNFLRPRGLLDWETMSLLPIDDNSPDADDDGIPDDRDRCASTPAGARVSLEGCPIDSDGDGIFDGLDRCPRTARGTQIDKRGCPES